jgi:hypothetical protein
MAEGDDNKNKTYRGNCHCKAFVYEFDHPGEIKSVAECNCSICTKTGALWVYPPPETFRVVQGSEDDLTSYTFGTGIATHKVSVFPTCVTRLRDISAKTMGLTDGFVTVADLTSKFCPTCATPLLVRAPGAGPDRQLSINVCSCP